METTTRLMHHSMKELRIRQMWPQKGQTSGGFFYFRYFITLLFASPFWLGLLLHLIHTLRGHLEISLSADIGVLTSMLGLHFILVSFVWGHENIAYLFDRLVDFKQFGKPDNFEEYVKKLNLYSKLYAWYCVIGVFIYMIIKHLEIPECERLNRQKGYNEVCGLIVPIWTPFYLNFTPVRELLLVNQFFSVFMIITGGAVMSFTTLETALVIVLKMRHLGRLLTEVFDHPSYEFQRKQLNFCIEYHQHIISLQELFDSRYKYPNGSYVAMVGIVVAALVNQFVKENNIGALIHCSGWMISFFICSHAGQYILTESELIGHAAYNSKWYNAPLNLRRDLLIIIIRSQQLLELHAAPLGTMSHELYVTIVKTSSSYFALLNSST